MKLQQQIRVEAIKTLYEHIAFWVPVAQLFAVFFAMVYLHQKNIEIWWPSIVGIVFALALDPIVYYFYQKAAPQSYDEFINWDHLLVATSFVVGVAWSNILLSLSQIDIKTGITIIAMLTVYMALASVFAAIRPWVFFVVTLPPIVVCAYEAISLELYIEFAGSFISACVLVYSHMKFSQKNFADSISLRMQNSELIKKLDEKRKTAENQSQSKTRFLATASHDLRQPLQSIRLLTAALKNQQLPSQSKSIVGKLEDSSHTFSELLNSLLDISKLDANIIRPNFTVIDLKTLLAPTVMQYQKLAQQKGLDLIASLPKELYISTDTTLLIRIINNLLENSLHYTDQGEIRIITQVDKEHITLIVADTGIGISPENQQKIFVEFVQLKDNGKNNNMGLGLGLSIVSRLAVLLNIDIHVESKLKEGTRFILNLQRTDRPLSKEMSMPESQLKKIQGQVLVIDDNDTLRDSMRCLLESWGLQVLDAQNLETAMEALNHRNLEAINFVIADFHLEGNINGIELVSRLKNQNQALSKARCLILTGETNTNSLELIESSGLAYLHKPVSPDDLYKQLNTCI